jgi:hypothetical protein
MNEKKAVPFGAKRSRADLKTCAHRIDDFNVRRDGQGTKNLVRNSMSTVNKEESECCSGGSDCPLASLTPQKKPTRHHDERA